MSIIVNRYIQDIITYCISSRFIMNRKELGTCVILLTLFPCWVETLTTYTHGPVNELTGHEDVNNYQQAEYVIYPTHLFHA